jgi:hypothetical protein
MKQSEGHCHGISVFFTPIPRPALRLLVRDIARKEYLLRIGALLTAWVMSRPEFAQSRAKKVSASAKRARAAKSVESRAGGGCRKSSAVRFYRH